MKGLLTKLKIHVKNYNFLFVLLFFISACTGPKLVLDTNKVSFNEVLDQVQRQNNKIETFTGQCRISVDSEEFSGHFFADIYYVKNDSLLLSVTGPFGIKAGTLFLGKERFIFYNQMTNKFYNGTIQDFEDKNFFQFPLQLRDLVNIFLGRDDLPSMKIKNYTIDDGTFYIQAQNGNDGYQIWVDNNTGHIQKITGTTGERVSFTREYGFFIKSNGLYFPKQIQMIKPEEKQGVSIFYENLSINDEIDRGKFIIQISDRAEQINYFRE